MLALQPPACADARAQDKNRITDVGAVGLAEGLKVNRGLRYLNLVSSIPIFRVL